MFSDEVQGPLAATPEADATLVIPCLNEVGILGETLARCQAAVAESDARWVLLVADNGSDDGSQALAREAGAEVVDIPVRGYGAAVDGGIRAARTPHVVYLDADGTYDPADAVRLHDAAKETGADLVLGSRLKGEIEGGAMPTLHRWVGTPVLTGLIRHLYGAPVSDCNSGIRCVRRAAYDDWGIDNPGMEFASDMLVRAAIAGAHIEERPAKLARGPEGRVPHLRTWRDGTRHLLVILSRAPRPFWRFGLLALFLSLALGIPSLWGARPLFGGFEVFGAHTHIIAILIGFYGALSVNLAVGMVARGNCHKPPGLLVRLVGASEELLFLGLLAFAVAFALAVLWLVWRWSLSGWHDLHFTAYSLLFLQLTVLPVTLVAGIFQARLFRQG